jgi:gluconokinase
VPPALVVLALASGRRDAGATKALAELLSRCFAECYSFFSPHDPNLHRAHPPAMILLVMGVTGSGKTTIAKMLAERLGYAFLEADDFHSPANKEKMRAGIALSDADRLPWLDSIHQELVRQHGLGHNVVLACSALKESYRQRLAKGLPFKAIYLKGSYELIRSRLRARHGHFAGEAILADQFDNLEEPKDGITVGIELPPEEIVKEILKVLGEQKG